MSRINTTQMVHLGTSYGSRVQQVQQDPAVRVACKQAASDISTAVASTKAAIVETVAAWHRTGAVDAAAAPAAPLAA